MKSSKATAVVVESSETKTFSVKTSASTMLPSRGLWSETNLNDVSSIVVSLVLVVVVSELLFLYLEALLSVVVVNSDGSRLRSGFEVMFSVWQLEDEQSRAKLNNK